MWTVGRRKKGGKMEEKRGEAGGGYRFPSEWRLSLGSQIQVPVAAKLANNFLMRGSKQGSERLLPVARQFPAGLTGPFQVELPDHSIQLAGQ